MKIKKSTGKLINLWLWKERVTTLLRRQVLSPGPVGIAFYDVLGSESRLEMSFSTCVWTHLPLPLAHPHITTTFTHGELHMPSHLGRQLCFWWTYPASKQFSNQRWIPRDSAELPNFIDLEPEKNKKKKPQRTYRIIKVLGQLSGLELAISFL